MAIVTKKLVKLGTGSDEIAAIDISADFPSPSGYSPDSTDIKGHLTGIDTSITNKVTISEVADLSNKTVIDALTVQEIATPSTPATGDQKFYPKSDGKWYQLDDAGVETVIGLNTDNEIAMAHWHPTSTDWKILRNEFTTNRQSQLDSTGVPGDVMGFGYYGTQSQAAAATAGRLGVFKFTTVTNSATKTGMSTDEGHTFKGGVFETRYGFAFKIDALPDVSDNVTYLMGFGDDENTSATKYIQLGIAFTDNNTNYVVRTHDGVTPTIVDTGVAFDTNWHSFEIHTNVDWTSIKFYIDGVLVHTATTNLPSTEDFQYDMTSVNQTILAAAKTWNVDWCYFAWKPTTERDSVIYLD